MTDTNLTRKNQCSATLLLLGLLIVVVVGAFQPGLAAGKEVWAGVVENDEEGLILAELTVDSGKYSLHYGVPRSCRLEGEEVFADDDKIILRFKDSSGGICKDLYQGTMTIDKDSPKKWNARVEKKAIDFEEVFMLLKK
jgi:hypothetical protein